MPEPRHGPAAPFTRDDGHAELALTDVRRRRRRLVASVAFGALLVIVIGVGAEIAASARATARYEGARRALGRCCTAIGTAETAACIDGVRALIADRPELDDEGPFFRFADLLLRGLGREGLTSPDAVHDREVARCPLASMEAFGVPSGSLIGAMTWWTRAIENDDDEARAAAIETFPRLIASTQGSDDLIVASFERLLAKGGGRGRAIAVGVFDRMLTLEESPVRALACARASFAARLGPSSDLSVVAPHRCDATTLAAPRPVDLPRFAAALARAIPATQLVGLALEPGEVGAGAARLLADHVAPNDTLVEALLSRASHDQPFDALRVWGAGPFGPALVQAVRNDLRGWVAVQTMSFDPEDVMDIFARRTLLIALGDDVATHCKAILEEVDSRSTWARVRSPFITRALVPCAAVIDETIANGGHAATQELRTLRARVRGEPG